MYRRGKSERSPLLTNARLVVALVGEEPARCQVANGETFGHQPGNVFAQDLLRKMRLIDTRIGREEHVWQELNLGGCHYPCLSYLDAILVETDHVPDLDELGPSDNVRDQARDYWSHSLGR